MRGFYPKLAALLSGIVAFGFLAWAGVVWTSSTKLTEVLTAVHADLREVRIRQEYLVERVVELEKAMKRRLSAINDR